MAFWFWYTAYLCNDTWLAVFMEWVQMFRLTEWVQMFDFWFWYSDILLVVDCLIPGRQRDAAFL